MYKYQEAQALRSKGYTYAEIAKELNVPHNKVWALLHNEKVRKYAYTYEKNPNYKAYRREYLREYNKRIVKST